MVWTDGKSHPVCRADGLASLGEQRDGRRPPADAKDLWHGRAQPGSKRFPPLLVRPVAGELAVPREWDEARVGVCLAVADPSGNDFSQPRSGPVVDDGSRSERYEPGNGGGDSFYHPLVHGGRLLFPSP